MARTMSRDAEHGAIARSVPYATQTSRTDVTDRVGEVSLGPLDVTVTPKM